MFKNKKKNFFLNYSGNDYKFKNNFLFFNQNFLILKSFLLKNNFKKILYIVSTIFTLNKNILFVDINTNYNYLPINNNLVFNRSFKKLTKLIRYYDIHLIFYINLKKKNFLFKKLLNCNVINISLSKKLISKKFDLSFDFDDNYIYMYIFYVFFLKTYLNIKNNL